MYFHRILLFAVYSEGQDVRILALDYGDKRIGAAVCDELGIAARGLTTIIRKNNKADIHVISEFIANLDVKKVVIGYPKRIDGSEGRQCEKVNSFIKRLETHLSIPVVRWDETFSTIDAQDIVRENGRMRGKKRKDVIDRVAASVILQSYLDSQRGKALDSEAVSNK
jgi:putative Holliday junction resolvase